MFEQSWCKRLAVASAAALSIACLWSVPVRAAQPMAPLHWANKDGMSFISGGVGMHERLELFDLVGKYDVLFSFAQRGSGQFLTNINIELSRQGHDQPHVSMQSAGPYLFARLPEGQYRLTASAPGWESSSYAFEVRPHHRDRVYVTLEKQLPDTTQHQ